MVFNSLDAAQKEGSRLVLQVAMSPHLASILRFLEGLRSDFSKANLVILCSIEDVDRLPLFHGCFQSVLQTLQRGR